MKFPQTEISMIRSASERIGHLLASIETAEHDLEKQALVDEVTTLVRPGPGRTLKNFAQEIAEQGVSDAIEDFIAQNAERFYSNELSARKAAENCDKVAELNIRRRALDESPSQSVAAQMLETFSQFLASDPLPLKQKTAPLA